MADTEKIEIRLRRPLRRRLVVFAFASIVGLLPSRFALGVFFAGVGVGIVTFAIRVSSRFLRSELCSALLWLFPLVSYLLTLNLNKPDSEMGTSRLVSLAEGDRDGVPYRLGISTTLVRGV